MAKDYTKRVDFAVWIEEQGVHWVAKKLDVDTSTVRNWRRGAAYPRVEQMRKIKKITLGTVGYEQIIDGTPIIYEGSN